MLRYQTRSCTGLAVRVLRKNKKAEDQRDDENPKQTSQIRAIYAAVSAVPFSLLHHLSHHPQRDRQLEVDAGGVVHSHTGGRGLLFPNYRNPKECMTATTLNRALERMGFNGKDSIGFSAHGFRATASTILNEMGYRPDVIERQLAHAERNKVRASYNQAEYMEDRRTMMQEWADKLDEWKGQV